jgi:hypothetical protein
MADSNEHYQSILKLVLPVEIFDYFEIVEVFSDEKTVDVHLDERDVKPEKYASEKLTSKGFHPSAMIQDYPLRNKAVFLHVRRRRWLVESTGEIVSRDWQTVAEGTRFTKGFADFLKGIFGHLPHQQ